MICSFGELIKHILSLIIVPSRRVCKSWRQAGTRLPSISSLITATQLAPPRSLPVPSPLLALLSREGERPSWECDPYFDFVSKRWVFAKRVAGSSSDFWAWRVYIFHEDGTLLHNMGPLDTTLPALEFGKPASIAPVLDGSVLRICDTDTEVTFLSHYRGCNNTEPALVLCERDEIASYLLSLEGNKIDDDFLVNSGGVVPAHIHGRFVILQFREVRVFKLMENGALELLISLDNMQLLAGVHGVYFTSARAQHVVLHTSTIGLEQAATTQLFYLDLNTMTLTPGRSFPTWQLTKLYSSVTECGFHVLALPSQEKGKPHAHVDVIYMRSATIVRRWKLPVNFHDVQPAHYYGDFASRGGVALHSDRLFFMNTSRSSRKLFECVSVAAAAAAAAAPRKASDTLKTNSGSLTTTKQSKKESDACFLS